MKNLILILVLFLAGEILSQTTAPNAYTTNYGFRKWAQGANPSADSINANWNELDATIKVVYDSAQAKVNAYGNQSIAGTKTFSDSIKVSNDLVATTLYGGSLYLGGYLMSTDALGSDVFWNSADTLATLADIRDAVLAGASFTGDVSVGQDLRTPYDSVLVSTTTISADNISFALLYTGGSAEEIETISGGSDGKILYLMNHDDFGYTITIKDNVGNIEAAGDFAMGGGDSMTLIYNPVSVKWYELSRSNN